MDDERILREGGSGERERDMVETSRCSSSDVW